MATKLFVLTFDSTCDWRSGTCHYLVGGGGGREGGGRATNFLNKAPKKF